MTARSRTVWALVLAACWLVAGAAWAQDPTVADAGRGPVEVVPGKVLMRALPFADGLVRHQDWSSVRVTIANGGPSTRAELILESRGLEESERQRYERGVELPRGARKDITLDYIPGVGGKSRTVNVLTAGEAFAVEFPVTVLSEHDVAIGVLGDDTVGVNAVHESWKGAVPGRAPRHIAEGPRQVRTGLIPFAGAPEASTGYATLDWLVWPQADPSKLTAEQQMALRGWVADGGHLFISVTDTWRAIATSPLHEVLPVELTGTADLEDLDGLLARLHAFPAGPVTTPIATAAVRASKSRRIATLFATDEGDPLWVAGSYGLGTVHVLLANPTVAPLSKGVDREALWRHLLWIPAVAPGDSWSSLSDRPLGTVLMDEALPWTYDGTSYYVSNYSAAPGAMRPIDQLVVDLDLAASSPTCFHVQSLSHYVVSGSSYWGDDPVMGWETRIREDLQDIPGVAPLPLSWLIAFSLLYLVMIGPVDYLALRWLNRQPWTWVTFPITIAIFSTVALVGTSVIKGNQAVMTRVEVVDVLPGTGLWRGDAYLGVFATRKTNVRIRAAHDDAKVVPLMERGTMYDSVIETLEGSGELKWRAETWTLAYGRTSWIAEEKGGVQLELLPENGGWRITNRLGTDLEHTELHAAGYRYRLGPLADGASTEVRPPSDMGAPSIRTLHQLVVNQGDRLEYDYNPGLSWAIHTLTEQPDPRRGHLDLFGHVSLIGATTEGVAPIELVGLRPVTRTKTIFRVPLEAP